MARSPRKNLKRAVDALDELLYVCERHPEARAELSRSAGESALRDITGCRTRLNEILVSLEKLRGASDASQANNRGTE